MNNRGTATGPGPDPVQIKCYKRLSQLISNNIRYKLMVICKQGRSQEVMLGGISGGGGYGKIPKCPRGKTPGVWEYIFWKLPLLNECSKPCFIPQWFVRHTHIYAVAGIYLPTYRQWYLMKARVEFVDRFEATATIGLHTS